MFPQPQLQRFKRTRGVLQASRKQQPHNRQAERPDGQKRQCADRIKPAARKLQKPRSRQLRKRQDKSRKQAPHRAVNCRQPEIPHACAKRHEANGRCHGRFYEPVSQKGKPRQKRCHRVNAAKQPCQNHPPPTKLFAAKPRAARKKPRVDRRVQSQHRLPANPHPAPPNPFAMDKV